jgi:hypothetical protein
VRVWLCHGDEAKNLMATIIALSFSSAKRQIMMIFLFKSEFNLKLFASVKLHGPGTNLNYYLLRLSLKVHKKKSNFQVICKSILARDTAWHSRQ